jgi:hypothetical protein
MVLVASLSTVLGDRGSERDLCVGWFSMLICSEVGAADNAENLAR